MFRSHTCRRAVALGATMALGLTLVGCSTSAAPSSSPHSSSTPQAASVSGACQSLVRVDAVPQPGGGPDEPASPEALKAFGKAVLVPLRKAIAFSDHTLRTNLSVLEPVAVAAAEKGTPIPEDDEKVNTAITGYHEWAHANCGYQNVDLMAVDYAFENLPDSLKAGPVSLSMMNHSDKGEIHVAVVLRSKDPQISTVEKLLAVPLPELEGSTEVLGVAAAPPGASGGILLDLKPGRYFVVCPVPVGGDESSGDIHMAHGMASVLEVK